MPLGKWIVSLVILHCCCNSLSQTRRFTRYTTENGLLSDGVYGMHQDNKGYLWVFTKYGALKYTGSEFQPVLRNLAFNDSFFYCICENSKGQKWVANSKAKIYEIINDSAFIVKGTESVSEKLSQEVSEISTLHVDDSLNIYAATKQGCYKFVRNASSYSSLNLSTRINDDSVAYLVLKLNNSLIPVYNFKEKKADYWPKLKGRTKIIIPYGKKPGEYSSYEIILDGNGEFRTIRQYGNEFYFSHFDRLGKISGNTLSYKNIGSFINTYIKDKNGHTWLACVNKGIYELNEKDSVINHYFENITINDLLIDSQGGLWASSSEHGLFHCENLSDLYFYGTHPLAGSIKFIKQIEDRLFISTSQGDVYTLQSNKFELVFSQKEFGVPLDIVKYNSHYLMSYTFGMVEFQIDWDDKPRILFSEKNRVVNMVRIIEQQKDSLIYLGRKGIGTYYNHSIARRTDFNFRTNDACLRHSDYILATDKGIYIRNKNASVRTLKATGDFPIFRDSLVQPSFLSHSNGTIITRITADSSGRFWFSSLGSGIFLLDDRDSLSHLTIADGLPTNIIHDIEFTTDGRSLLSTNRGFFISLEKKTALNACTWNKLYSGEVKCAGIYRNKIYLGTANGLVVLNYDKIKRKSGVRFNLNSVFVNSTQVDTGKLKRLNHNQNKLEFRFDILDFSGDKPGLRYHLSGPTLDSGQTTNAGLKFINLLPGRYSLNVFPDIELGENQKILFHFNIEPAIWQTLLFRIVCITTTLLIILYSFWSVTRRIRKKREQKEEAEKLILEYKLIALKAQINPHFVSNCLSAIQLLIVNKKLDSATNYIARFGLLVRQILNFSTRSLVSLKEEIEIAHLNVEMEQLRFENKFRFEILIGKNIDPERIYVPSLILNPIIENAIWHGLLPLKNKRNGKLVIEVKKNEDALSLIIEDNGVGRNLSSKKMGNTRSKGIHLTVQRLDNINYLYTTRSSKINYVDLYDDANNNSGTRVTISLPLNLVPLQNE